MVLLQGALLPLLWSSLQELIEGLTANFPYIVLGLIVFLIFLGFARAAKALIVEIGKRTHLDITLARVLGSLTAMAVSILGILIAAVIIFPTFSPGNLVAGLGITSVAIGFAFKDILQNMFAGLLILWRKPFRIGDQIRTQTFEGTVEEINIRSTFLQTYVGERVVIPNGDIYTHPIVVNTAYEKRRVRFTVGIGYLDSVEEARRVIYEVLDGLEGVMGNPGPWVYVTELAPSQVNFEVFFWTDPHQANVLKVRNEVVTGIKLGLDRAGIDMPYPHRVVLFHDATGTRPGDIEQGEYLKHPVDGRG